MKYENYETACLDKIEERLIGFSEMSREEREFVNGLIRHHRPKKILEVGVSAGSSSAILLNAAADYGAEVHSIDYLDYWYKDKKKESGFLVKEHFPELMSSWHFYSGTISAGFMEQIGGDIDFCLIDTMHHNPGEFLDFLMVLPYLKPEAIIVLHDVALNTLVGNFDEAFGSAAGYDRAITCNILFSCLRGQRILPSRKADGYAFANIGAIQLSPDINQDLWPFFKLLTLPWIDWHYLKAQEWEMLSKFMAQHYRHEYQEFFQQIVTYKDMRQTFKIGQTFPALAKPQPETKSLPIKTCIKFIKSYFLFPWYVYKIYKKIQ